MNSRTSDAETQSSSFSTSITQYEQQLFRPVESELRSSFRSVNVESMIGFLAMSAESQYIPSSLLSSILSQFATTPQREEMWKELLLPFYVLPKEGLLNSMISYKYYVNFNLRFLLMKEMNAFSYETLYKEEHEAKLKLSPMYNLTSYGSDLRLDLLSVVVLLLFYSEIDAERKAEILFKLLDSDYHGQIQTGRKKVYLVVRMMILTALYLPDVLLNRKVNDIPIEEKVKSDEQFNGNEGDGERQLQDKQTSTRQSRSDGGDTNKDAQTVSSNESDKLLLKHFRELIADYKKILLYCKHKNGFMKNFVVFVFNSVVFTKSNVKALDLQEFKKECKRNGYSIFEPATYRGLLQSYLLKNVGETKNYLSNFPTVVKQLTNTVIANQEEYHLIVERVVNVYSEYKDCESLFKSNYPIIKDLLAHTVDTRKNQIHEFHKATKKKKKKRNKRELDQYMSFDKHQDEEDAPPEEKKETIVVKNEDKNDNDNDNGRLMQSNNVNELIESINQDRHPHNGYNELSTSNNVDDNEHEPAHDFSENQEIMPFYPDHADDNVNSSDDAIHNEDNNNDNRSHDDVGDVDDDHDIVFKANNSNDLNDDDFLNQPNPNETKPFLRFTENERFSESTNQLFNISPNQPINLKQSHPNKEDTNNFNLESGFFKSIDNVSSKPQPHQLEHTLFFKDYFSQMETYKDMNDDTLIERIALLDQDSIREISFDNLTPFLSGYSPKKLNSIFKGDTINELMINLYFNLMTRYNEHLRREGGTAVKAVFFETNFFTDLQRANEDEKLYSGVIDKYRDSLYRGNTLIFDDDEYTVVVPVYVNEKYLFLALIENEVNTITFLDSNDQLSDHSELVGNYERTFLRWFEHLNGEGLSAKDLSRFKCVNDSIEALCYDNTIAKQLMLYYAKQICVKGKIQTVNEDDYQGVKHMIYAELAMFYLKLNDFISQ